MESFKRRAKKRRAYQQRTWQVLVNASTHVSLVLIVAYTVCNAVYGIGKLSSSRACFHLHGGDGEWVGWRVSYVCGVEKAVYDVGSPWLMGIPWVLSWIPWGEAEIS